MRHCKAVVDLGVQLGSGVEPDVTFYEQNAGTVAIAMLNTSNAGLRVAFNLIPTSSGTLREIIAPMYKGASLTGSVVFNLYASNISGGGGIPTGPVLATYTVSLTGMQTSNNVNNTYTAVGSGYSITAGTQYFLVPVPDSLSGTGVFSMYYGDVGVLDSVGKVSQDSGATWTNNYNYIDMRYRATN